MRARSRGTPIASSWLYRALIRLWCALVGPQVRPLVGLGDRHQAHVGVGQDGRLVGRHAAARYWRAADEEGRAVRERNTMLTISTLETAKEDGWGEILPTPGNRNFPALLNILAASGRGRIEQRSTRLRRLLP